MNRIWMPHVGLRLPPVKKLHMLEILSRLPGLLVCIVVETYGSAFTAVALLSAAKKCSNSRSWYARIGAMALSSLFAAAFVNLLHTICMLMKSSQITMFCFRKSMTKITHLFECWSSECAMTFVLTCMFRMCADALHAYATFQYWKCY